jgi:hypothetical protein
VLCLADGVISTERRDPAAHSNEKISHCARDDGIVAPGLRHDTDCRTVFRHSGEDRNPVFSSGEKGICGASIQIASVVSLSVRWCENSSSEGGYGISPGNILSLPLGRRQNTREVATNWIPVFTGMTNVLKSSARSPVSSPPPFLPKSEKGFSIPAQTKTLCTPQPSTVIPRPHPFSAAKSRGQARRPLF